MLRDRNDIYYTDGFGCIHNIKRKRQKRKYKRKYAKLSSNDIYKATKEYVHKASMSDKSFNHFVTAEDIAYILNVKSHLVKQALKKLNLEGIVSQPVHHIPHDSSRDPWGGGRYSGWMADIYYINAKEVKI